jgi:hypothetical protein
MFTFEGRSRLLQRLFTPDDTTAPALGTLWMALVNGSVLPTDDGNSIPELAATSYTRVGIGALLEYWTLTAHGVLSNATAVYWPAATTDWGMVSGWALCTAAIGGEVIAGGDFLVSIQVAEADVIALAPGMLVLEVS